jgi:hypothetical protein
LIDLKPYCVYVCIMLPGKAKQSAARSCHQEVLRICKATWAAAAEAAAAAAAAAPGSSSDSSSSSPADPASTQQDNPTSSPEPEQAVAAQPVSAADNAAGHAAVDIMPGANGYLAAAELVLQLHLPGLARKLLDLAAGLKDPEGVLARRLKLAHTRAALATGVSQT